MDKKTRKLQVLGKLAHHVGIENAIGMGELYELIYEKKWKNRINDTRPIRKIIDELKKDGEPVCSIQGKGGTGYFIRAVQQELDNDNRRIILRVLKQLETVANREKISMPDLLSRMALNMRGGKDEQKITN